jgi:hypothetical protein
MSKTITAQAAYETVLREVEKIRNDQPAEVQGIGPGDVVRQGDIYVVRLDHDIPDCGPSPSRQLAPGTTQGSRHVADGDCDVLIPVESAAVVILARLIPQTNGHRQFIGPLIRARGPVTITHPEHGHRTLPGDAVYLVTYQRTWADEIRRVQD